MNPKIIILSGIPGSGKSTWAKNYVASNSWDTRIVSRDTIRESAAFDQPYVYTKENEAKVTIIFDIQLNDYASNGWNIILDNTNCKDFWIKQHLKNISENYPHHFVYIKFFDVPLWKAVWRAFWRHKRTGKYVPYSVIKDMHKSYKKMNRSQFKNQIL